MTNSFIGLCVILFANSSHLPCPTMTVQIVKKNIPQLPDHNSKKLPYELGKPLSSGIWISPSVT